MSFFGLGAPELLIIAAIAGLIFGVGRLPEIGGALGRSIREFKSNVSDEPPPAPAVPATTAPLPQAPETRAATIRREEI